MFAPGALPFGLDFLRHVAPLSGRRHGEGSMLLAVPSRYFESVEHLFAPWRMEYIGAKQEAGCLFCRALQADPANDASNLVVWRPPGALVMLNRFPYNNGHLMVAPSAHVGTLTELADAQLLELMTAVRGSLTVLEREM